MYSYSYSRYMQTDRQLPSLRDRDAWKAGFWTTSRAPLWACIEQFAGSIRVCCPCAIMIWKGGEEEWAQMTIGNYRA